MWQWSEWLSDQALNRRPESHASIHGCQPKLQAACAQPLQPLQPPQHRDREVALRGGRGCAPGSQGCLVPSRCVRPSSQPLIIQERRLSALSGPGLSACRTGNYSICTNLAHPLSLAQPRSMPAPAAKRWPTSSVSMCQFRAQPSVHDSHVLDRKQWTWPVCRSISASTCTALLSRPSESRIRGWAMSALTVLDSFMVA